MSFWSFFKLLLIALFTSPFLSGLIGIAALTVTGRQPASAVSLSLIALPVGAAAFLLFGGIQVLIGTAIAGTVLSAIRIWLVNSPILFWLVAALCIASIPTFHLRFPNGDGGTMQGLTEQIKAMFAASVAIWCVLSANKF